MHEDKKHYAQIINELTSLQQHSRETIQQYSIRIESTLKRSVNAVQQNCIVSTDLNGQISILNQIALNRLVYYCIPDISCQLRIRDPKNLDEAISYALNEEQIQNMYSKNPFKRTNNTKFCKYCRKPGHDVKDCFKKPESSSVNHINNKTYRSNNSDPSGSTTLRKESFCKYCKNKGYTIDECRQRQYFAKKNEHSRNVNQISEVTDEIKTEEQSFQVTIC
ncbi:hypothetical protein QE152_g30060 [Popillia japonica]|uniref:CCHC-type domain-containing protein n=1 Tax=Popillia japonica TaxID=7064 RepID=A0AAW1JFL6_POPJA